MDKKTDFHHSALCIHRWTYPIVNFGRGEMRYCCRTPPRQVDLKELREIGAEYFSNNKHEVKRRAEMSNGVRHGDCSSCWVLEDKGVLSPRSSLDVFLNYKSDMTWRDHYPNPRKALLEMQKREDFLKADYPISLEVMLTNACNMKCIYCSHHYSTQWAKEKIEFGEMTAREIADEQLDAAEEIEKHFWDWLRGNPISTLDYITILGGEPLITNEFYKFSEKLIGVCRNHKKSGKPLTLNIVTNLNLTDAQMDRFIAFAPELAKYFQLDLNLSMESVGARAEYIRHGLVWDRWENNLNRLLQAKLENATISFQAALNCLSISSLPDFLKMVHGKIVQYHTPLYLRRNSVSTPAVHSYLYLPAEFSKYLAEAVSFMESVAVDVAHLKKTEIRGWPKYKRFLAGMRDSLAKNQPTDKQMVQFYDWFRINDERRKSQITHVFPELTDYWNACRRKAEELRSPPSNDATRTY